MQTEKSVIWPAEWETHAATWMIFPCRESIWQNGMEKAINAYSQVANHISEFESVNMLVKRSLLNVAQKKLSSQIKIIECNTDDSWARDVAPIWVQQSGELIGLDFRFNAWGEKFSPYHADAAVAKKICELSKTQHQPRDWVLEGGAIHGNGQGVLLTTDECLLNANRNPQMTKAEIEQALLATFNAHSVIWLKKGIAGDVDTDGHIDNIACFIDEKTILSQSANSKSENCVIYEENKKIIRAHGFNYLAIEEPEPVFNNGQRVPLSYINFYFANDSIMFPTFGCRQDDQALAKIKELFPNKKVIDIDAREIVTGGGGIHCITMQQPINCQR